MRRGLSVGIGSSSRDWDDLPYAKELAEELRAALTGLGYVCTEPEPLDLSAEALGGLVHGTIEAAATDDLLVVHVVAHAERSARTGKLYVIGADGQRHLLTDVESWLTTIEETPDRARTLFLLDVCQAGQAARLPWQARLADGSARAWVIGACAPDEASFDGRLTRAVVNVLKALRHGELDIDPALDHAPFPAVARAIGLEVKRLTEQADGIPQQVTGSIVDVTVGAPDLPFFPNPAYPPSPARRARAEVDAAIGPFLDDVDEALDAAHFYERASGRQVTDQGPAEHAVIGCFSGRRKELRELVPWLHGYEQGGLRVVTGSPGVGKSALLGVLVCAAHPRLRRPTQGVWSRIEAAPWQLDSLAAVHARQRDLGEVVGSLARQLGLPATTEPDALLAALAPAEAGPETAVANPVTPVIVLDALDEAHRPAELLDWLLLPLARAVRPNGTPACRLLIGTRRWGFESLLEPARKAGGLIDLDEVDRDVLRGELETYVYELLGAHPAFRDLGGVCGAFATEVAKTLSVPPEQGEERWGEFLVAGMYTHQFAADGEASPPDAGQAAETGARVPRTLAEVFELDLGDRYNVSWLRPVLTVLAYTCGEGMPADLVRRCAHHFGTEFTAPPGHEEINTALQAARFYLRRATDTDGTTLYRLFHAGLAEHLRGGFNERTRPRPLAKLIVDRTAATETDTIMYRRITLYRRIHAGLAEHLRSRFDEWTRRHSPAGLIFEAMLEPIEGPDGRRWDLAEPYARRHAVEHAVAAERLDDLLDDPEFLVHADAAPATTLPALGSSANPEVATLAALLESTGHDDTTPARRRVALARAAARQGRSDLAERLANPPDQPPLTWQPRWTAAAPDRMPIAESAREAPFQLGDPLIKHTGKANALAILDLDGATVAVTAGSDGTVRLWDLITRGAIGGPLTGHTGPVASITTAHVHGRPIALTGGVDKTVRLWDLRSRAPMGAFLGHTGAVMGVAVTHLNRRPVVVTGGVDQTVRLWDLTTLSAIGDPLAGHKGAVRGLAVADVDGRPVAVTGGIDRTVRLWDLNTRSAIGVPLTGHTGSVSAVAVAHLGGRPVAVTAGLDGYVAIWDLRNRKLRDGFSPDDSPAAIAMSTGHLDGRPIAVTSCDDGMMRVWDLATRIMIARLAGHTAIASALAVGQLDGRPLAAVGDEDSVRVWVLGSTAVPTYVGLGRVDESQVAVIANTQGKITARSLNTGAVVEELRTGDVPVTGIGPPAPAAGSANPPKTVVHRANGTTWLWDIGAARLTSQRADTSAADEQPAVVASTRPRVGVVADGRPIVVEGQVDGGLARYDPTSGGLLSEPLAGHRGEITATDATRIGGRPVVVTGSRDRTVRTWDVAQGAQLDVIDSLPGEVTSLCLTRDGHLLVAAGREVLCFRHHAFVRPVRAERQGQPEPANTAVETVETVATDAPETGNRTEPESTDGAGPESMELPRSRADGRAEVLTFDEIEGLGLVAVARVLSGVVLLYSRARLVRNGRIVADGLTVLSLRRLNEVGVVRKGVVCGIYLGYDDMRVGDLVESYPRRREGSNR